MAKRKKRNAITMVSLLLALAALIGVYTWYSNRPVASDKADEVTPTIDLATIDTTQLTSLHYIMDDADLTLVLQDGAWVSKDEPGRPLNQDNVLAILKAISDIKADQIIMEKPENLEDYGLAKPVASLEATMADGSIITLKVGNEAVDSKGYYGMVKDDGIVYMLPTELGSALKYNNTQMTAIAKSPDITAENIASISVSSRDNGDFELRYVGDGKLDNTGNNMSPWKILKPYGEGFTADSSLLADVQANYTTFNYLSCIDYKGDDLTQYGLDKPAATIDIGYFVTSTETLAKPVTDPATGKETTEKTTQTNKEYKVYIGNTDTEGNYYIRVDGSNTVYTIDAATVEKMLKFDAFSVLNPYICIPNIETVDQVVFDIEGKKYTLDIKHTTAKDADGKEESVKTFTFNGKEVTSSAACTKLYQAMISTKYDTEMKDTVTTDGLTPYMTMSFHIFGDEERTITTSFLPYDDSFYLIQKDGGTRFLADKRLIETIANTVSQFTGEDTE